MHSSCDTSKNDKGIFETDKFTGTSTLMTLRSITQTLQTTLPVNEKKKKDNEKKKEKNNYKERV